MALLDKRLVYSPFEYPEAHDYWLKQQMSHWLHTEISLNSDVMDWHTKLSESEKEVINRTLKGFVQMEVIVEDYWSGQVAKWFKKPEIQMMASAFAAMESIHAVSYSYLQETLGLTDFSAFLHEPSAKAKIDRLLSARGKTRTDIARSLAIFSAFTEGVNLFSSFAILLSFSRKNLLKGVGQIITFSIKDECYAEGTEVLTPSGWKDLKDITLADKVAQFNLDDSIEFVNPTKTVSYEVKDKMVQVTNHNNNVNLLVTKNHRMLTKNVNSQSGKCGKYIISEAEKTVYNASTGHISSGTKVGGRSELTPLERLRIAFQADGSMPDSRHTGERAGYLRVKIDIKKQRKIDRLRDILRQTGLEYSEFKNNKGGINFLIDSPLDISKKFNWINLESVSGEWCQEFIKELMHWDGSDIYKDGGTAIHYSTIDKYNSDIVQAVAALSGYRCHYALIKDNRKETYSDIHRIRIHTNFCHVRGNSIKKELVDYEGTVRCLSVPSGLLVVRYKNVVAISGNSMHSSAGCWLFRTFVKEYPEVLTDQLKEEIYDAARLTVQLEDHFIDQSFSVGKIESISEKDLKAYIRFRTNTKLKDLGLRPIYLNIDKDRVNNLEWFSVLSSGVEFQDFFANRVTTYSKAVADFDTIWN